MPRLILSAGLFGLMATAGAGPAEPPATRAIPAAGKARGDTLWDALDWIREREAYARFLNVTFGVGESWFKPGQSRHDWKWLAGRCDRDGDGAVSRAEFPGPKATFDRLDRNGDDRLTAADLDWSRASGLGKGKGAKGDRAADGSKGKRKGPGQAFSWTRFKAFFHGDVGSWLEGPALNAAAPEFTLPTPDGKRQIALSELHRDKPVVLIFGSFT